MSEEQLENTSMSAFILGPRVDASVVRQTGGAWQHCQRSEVAATLRRHPAGSFIAYEKRYSEIISVKGRTSQVFCHPWHLHTCEATRPPTACSTCQRAEAFIQKLELLLQRPDKGYCLSLPTYSKQGGGPAINNSLLSGHSDPFQVGRTEKNWNTDMSALFVDEV